MVATNKNVVKFFPSLELLKKSQSHSITSKFLGNDGNRSEMTLDRLLLLLGTTVTSIGLDESNAI